jgi:hypothetical protein
VPPEIITGYADVNHWNVAQITHDTFKQHLEPGTIRSVDALTQAYMRHRLRTAVELGVASWTRELIDRVVIWYDPASLITPPDMRDAANDAHEHGTISDAAHRRALGFDEGDAPEVTATSDQPLGTTGMTAAVLSQVAEVAGALMRAGYVPGAVSTALGLTIEHTGYLPVTVKPPEDPDAVQEQPALPAPTPPAEEPQEAPEALPPGEGPEEGEEAARALTAAAGGPPVTDKSRRLSRRLLAIDRTLRERLQAAADAALARALERAGNRLRSRANGNPEARTAAAGVPGERVAAAMGRTIVAALGVEEQELLAEAFDRFRGQYTEWTLAAAEEAIDTAAAIAGLSRTDPNVMRLVAALRDHFTEAVELSWPGLEAELLTIAEGNLYDPDPSTPELGEIPVTTVPPQPLRNALAVAGGLAADATGLPPLSGLTSGQLLSAFLRDTGGSTVTEYEWSYGISARPFLPHQRLDGMVFTNWDDQRLSTAGTGGEWVGGSFAPGDHRGCHCDFMPIWSDGGRARAEAEAVGRRAYEEQNPGRPVPGWEATVNPRVNRPGNRMPDLDRPDRANPEPTWTRLPGRAPSEETLDEIRIGIEIADDEGWDAGLRVDLDENRLYVSDSRAARATLADRTGVLEDELRYASEMGREEREAMRRKLRNLNSIINRLPD